jgi:hypothetical protein
MVAARILCMSDVEDLAKSDREYLAHARVQLNRWKRRTVVLGLAFAASIIAVIPFLKGFPLHRYWYGVRYLIWLCCALLFLLTAAGAIAYNQWWYWRMLKKDARMDPMNNGLG